MQILYSHQCKLKQSRFPRNQSSYSMETCLRLSAHFRTSGTNYCRCKARQMLWRHVGTSNGFTSDVYFLIRLFINNCFFGWTHSNLIVFINSAILLGSVSSWLSSSRDQINISEELNSNSDEYEKGITANYGTPLQRVVHPSVFRGQGMGTRLSVVQGNCGCWFTSKVPRIFLYSILIYFAVHGNI